MLDSDIVFIHLPMQPTLLLTSAQAVSDLMDKRSTIYSDKPATIMDELCASQYPSHNCKPSDSDNVGQDGIGASP